MDARNPRSKLGMMKRRYFIVTMTVFLGLFLVAYLMTEILFMIFEAEPYTRLLVVFVLLVFDFVTTDHIINQVLKDRWPREAPDILDVIKTPEPAYIPEGPADAAKETAKPENKPDGKPERQRLHRTQYQELSKELPADKTIEKPTQSEPPVSEIKTEQPAGPEPKKRIRFPKPKKQKERIKETEAPKQRVPDAEALKQNSAAPQRSSWMPDLDDMDTVEFEDAVMRLEERIHKKETKHTDEKTAVQTARVKPEPKSEAQREKTEPKRNEEERNAQRRRNRNHRQEKKPQNPAVPAESSPKHSAWSGSLDDMDTVSVSRAIQNISPSEAPEKQNRRKRRRRSRSSGNQTRKESVSPVEKPKG